MISRPCEDVKDRLSEFLDREATERDWCWIEAHLESCADCQAELNELHRLRKLLRGANIPAPAEGFWDELTDTVRQHPATRRHPARRWPLPVALALGSILAAALVVSYSAPPTPQALVVAAPDDADLFIAQHAQHSSAYPLADWSTLSYIDAQEDARSPAVASGAEPHQ